MSLAPHTRGDHVRGRASVGHLQGRHTPSSEHYHTLGTAQRGVRGSSMELLARLRSSSFLFIP